MGGTTPDLPPVDQTPHLTLIGPSPDHHVISRVFLVYKSQRLARENSNCFLRHGGRPLVSL